jgi:hypothetical protein
MMEMKCFIKHLPDPSRGIKIDLAMNHVGFTASPEPHMVQGGEKGSKKIPNLRMEDWGFYPLTPFTVLSSKTFQ